MISQRHYLSVYYNHSYIYYVIIIADPVRQATSTQSSLQNPTPAIPKARLPGPGLMLSNFIKVYYLNENQRGLFTQTCAHIIRPSNICSRPSILLLSCVYWTSNLPDHRVAFIKYILHRVQKKVVYFVFERNFTHTGSIFLQFSITITE